MSLSAGHRLGPYEIVAPLGAGGMGEVYRARDTKLDREVAVKVLPARFADDETALVRFEREAKAVAALSHPSILAIHDFGSESGTAYAVMELLDGETLRRRLAEGALPVRKAVDSALQIAQALAAAHDKGIVHRDLKPENVFVTHDGRLKVLDFGLAKRDVGKAAGGETSLPTAVHATEPGTVLGTVGYMSPEQVRGQTVDARSDIFSLGVLLYEMLSGRNAFARETAAETMTAILREEPADLVTAVEGLPLALGRIVQHCLEKRPEERFQSARDLAFDLSSLVDSQSRPPGDAIAAPAVSSGSRPRVWPAVAALALAAGAAAGWLLHRPPPPFEPPELTRITYDSGLTCDPALSPDGKLLAYASDRAGGGNLDIWVQHVSGGDPVQLTRDPSDESAPSFSPDGAQIVYRSERDGGGIHVISALGGEPTLVAREGRNPRFSPDGAQIAYWTGKGGRSENLARQGGRMFVVPASGGEPRQMAPDIPFASTPAWSSDGRMLVFVGIPPPVRQRRYTWFVTRVADDRPVATNADEILGTPDGQVPTPARWGADHRVLYSARRGQGANLHQVLLDPGTARLGPPERLTFGGAVEDAPSPDSGGRLAFADLTWNFDLWSLPVDTRSGRVGGEPVRLTDSPAAESFPSVSQDGRQLAFLAARGPQSDLWLRDLDSGESTKLLSTETSVLRSAWIALDGSSVAYTLLKDGVNQLHSIPASGGLPRRLSDEDRGSVLSWTPSGGIVHFVGAGIGNGSPTVAVIDPGSLTSRVVFDTSFVPYQASFSPDERWISFVIVNTPQTAQLMIAPATGAWPIPESEWVPIGNGTGWEDKPRWSPDGRLLYFTSERDGYRCLWAQRLDPQTRQPAGEPWAVHHSHSSRRSILNVGLTPLEVAIGPDRIVFVQGEVTGNIWIAQPR